MRGFGVAMGMFSLMTGVAIAQTAPAPVAAPAVPAAQQARMAAALKDYHGPEYARTEVMIPVRDGAKLHTIILRPVDSEKGGTPLPFLMTRTPYGVDGASPNSVKLGKKELAESGYIYVEQDIRGRYKSEGQFVMNRPVVDHKTKNDVDETTDTCDTIDWLLKNVPNNNGRVGVLGVSYPGFLAMMAGIDAHPAVKAISPQAPMTDIWLGDDFFHNGAFRETYGFDYVQELEAQKTDIRADSKEDQYDFFLNHVNFEGAAESAKMQNLPTAKVFLSQPSYVKFWQDMAVEPRLHRPEVPTLEVGGYWDQEDMWGTQAEYAALRPNEPADETDKVTGAHKVYMVLGPWNHGGWSRGPGDELGGKFGTANFGGEKTGEYYRSKIEYPFFEFYLKDKPGFDLKDTASFRSGENQWHRYDVWPPKQGFHHQDAYLSTDGALSAKAAGANAKSATYVADPANPIPFRHRPVQSTYGDGSTWRTWLVEDQKFVSGRKDLANFSTPVLQKDVTVTGDVVANLMASTTGTDADWIVKLIDVYPESEGGYQLMVGEEILRGRYRKSFTSPEPVKPGEPTEYKWSLHGVDHTFTKGHKIMVEVQSSWFPLYDRNPQTYVENIMKAPASAYKAETITIYGGSHLDLPMTDSSSLP
jgi:putative CocE/NonD family hydrolase